MTLEGGKHWQRYRSLGWLMVLVFALSIVAIVTTQSGWLVAPLVVTLFGLHLTRFGWKCHACGRAFFQNEWGSSLRRGYSLRRTTCSFCNASRTFPTK